MTQHPKFLIPVGTQVVTLVPVEGPGDRTVYPAGAVAVVVKAPLDNTQSYRVRFPDGFEASLKKHHLAIHKHFQEGEWQQADVTLPNEELYEYVIYRCVVGSRAYGLEGEASDVDRRGIYLPPAERHWSLFGVPEQLERHETQEAYWELQKFLILALKANPNILECLYTPLVELATPLAEELLAMRSQFLSQLVYQTYNGYVMSQFKKLNQDIKNRGQVRWKHAMHLIRLLLSGITVLREGFVPVQVGEHRGELLAIRRGETAWDKVNEWRLDLHQEFDQAFAQTRLPERPNYEAANAFLIKARRSMAGQG